MTLNSVTEVRISGKNNRSHYLLKMKSFFILGTLHLSWTFQIIWTYINIGSLDDVISLPNTTTVWSVCRESQSLLFLTWIPSISIHLCTSNSFNMAPIRVFLKISDFLIAAWQTVFRSSRPYAFRSSEPVLKTPVCMQCWRPYLLILFQSHRHKSNQCQIFAVRDSLPLADTFIRITCIW